MTLHALVVDDSRSMRMILSRIMASIGAEVSEAGDGRQALELLRGGLRADVILVDWNMPEMDGLTFLRHLRADDALSGIPAMMVTTETESHQIEAALQAGANEYVVKPFDEAGIMSKLALIGVLCP